MMISKCPRLIWRAIQMRMRNRLYRGVAVATGMNRCTSTCYSVLGLLATLVDTAYGFLMWHGDVQADITAGKVIYNDEMRRASMVYIKVIHR